MDNKRLLIATVLCFLILFGWQFLAEQMGWVQAPQPQQQESIESSPQPAPLEPVAISPAVPQFMPTTGTEVIVDTPLYTATFQSGGILKSFVLKQYNDMVGASAKPLNMISEQAFSVSPMGLLLNGQPSWSLGEWSLSGNDLSLAPGQTASLTFQGSLLGIRLTRTITFSADTYLMDENINLQAESTPMTARLSYTLGIGNLSGGSNYDLMQMAWDENGSLKTNSKEKNLRSEGIMATAKIGWAGIMTNYFLAAIVPQNDADSSFKGRLLENKVWRIAVENQDLLLSPDVPVTARTAWWFGPKERDLLNTAPNQLTASIDMGIFSFLAVPMLAVMGFFQKYVGNWGIAIIVLTVLIKILFWPLTRKSYQSMEGMKKIQPMMAQLQEKYAGDKEALSREMMQLYKTYNINPMGGCLPMLIQLPVFVALYQGLLHSISLRHASFTNYLPFTDIVWLADLSAKDPLYITPIVMGATMFLQQWLAPAAGDPTQRKIMMLMPLIFTVMFLNFPSGLVLYWLCNNVLSIIQQWWTLRKA